MAGAIKRYDFGPVTFEVNAAVVGGTLVEPDGTTGKVKTATAGTAVCLGIAETDAIPTATDQNISATNILLSPIGPYVAVASEGFYDIEYAAACVAGAKVKVAANGTVTPWVSGTDASGLIVGICYIAATGATQKRLTKLTL